MKSCTWGDEYRNTVICVDSYNDSVLAGRLYNPYHKEGVGFKSLTQFLIEMEWTLDRMNFPQSFTETRNFSPPPKILSTQAPQSETHEGRLATFRMRVLFRQNASWQGALSWLEGAQTENFRSVLELILLMDSALRGGHSHSREEQERIG